MEDETKKKVDEIEIVDDDGARADEKLKKMLGRLKACESEKEEYLRGWQRAKADFINTKREFEAREETIITYTEGRIFMELLGIIDTFEKALEANTGSDKWATGVRRIYEECRKFLERHNVREIETHETVFDPRVHDAIEVEETDDEGGDNKITSVFQKGYMQGERVLRPARVRVAKHITK